MKRILSILVLVSILVVLVLPTVASAQIPDRCEMGHVIGDGVDCPGEGSDCLYSDESYDCGTCCLLNTVYNVTDWIFIVLVGVTVIFVLLGAFNYLTSAGDPEKTRRGRDYILYALVGAIVASFARALPVIIRSMIS